AQADGVGPQERAGDAAGQVGGDAHLGPARNDAQAVDQPDADRVLHRQFERLFKELFALFDGAEVVAREAVRNFVELGGRLVRLPQGEGETAFRVVEIEVPAWIAGDDRGAPPAGVDVEQAV